MNKAILKAMLVGSAFMCTLPQFALAHGGDAHAKKSEAPKLEQTAWGMAGEAKKVQHTISINMSDAMRFSPDRLQVKQGDTVRLKITNTGKIMHELVLGTKAVLDAHAEMMLQHPGMEHDEPYMAHVTPGQTGEIIWHFNRAGEFDFACLIAGHYQAGMRGKITVMAAKAEHKH
ncbi:MAG: hypothetical protein RLZZ502_1036 [Pseudomonadota bacterium]|jgi:uncharacterized cupredoxin-like copper-binding protein